MDLLTFAGWQLLVIASLIGWGVSLRRFLRLPEPDNRWGVDLLLGCAATVAVGALAIVTGVAGPAAWITIVVAGAVQLTVAVFRVDRHWIGRSRDLVSISTAVGTAVILFVVSLGNMLDRPWNRWDDEPSYFYFTRRLWELGDLHDIYNARRLQSHGATSLLQMLASGPLAESAFNAFDEVVGASLLFTFILALKGTGRRFWTGLLVVTIVAFHYAHGAGNSTTVLFFTASYAVVIHEVFVRWNADTPTRAGLIQIQLIVVMLLTMMRPFAGAVLVLFVGWQLLAGGLLRSNWFSIRTTSTLFAIGIPWMFLQYQDSRTPFYPLLGGVSSEVFPIAGDRSKVDIGSYMVDSVLELVTSGTIPWLGAVCVMAWVLWGRPARGTRVLSTAHAAFLALIVGMCIYTLLFAFTTPRGGTPLNWTRYWSPFVVGIGIAPVMLATRHPWSGNTWRRLIPVAQAMLVFGGFLVLPHNIAMEIGRHFVGAANGDYIERLSHDRFEKYRDDYGVVAAAVPDGSTVLSAVQLPHLLIDSEIDLYTVDFAVAAVPRGEFPSKGTFEAQLAWLLDQEVDFLVVHTKDADSVLYGYDVWLEGLKTTQKADAEIAEYMLEWLEFTYQLADSTDPVVISGDLVLISVERLR